VVKKGKDSGKSEVRVRVGDVAAQWGKEVVPMGGKDGKGARWVSVFEKMVSSMDSNATGAKNWVDGVWVNAD
jgi:hypothetical protein